MQTTNQPNKVNEQAEQAAAQKRAQMIKLAKYASIAAVAIVAVILVYVYAVRNPSIAAGNDAIAQADVTMLTAQGDSAKMATALKQYEAVAASHGYDAGNRAKLMAAISLYGNGEYEKCIELLNSFSSTGAVIDAGAKSLEGDCYVNLEKYDEALDCYEEAISTCDENPQLMPFFMTKQAHIYHEQKEYAKELKVYETIKKEYPRFDGIDRYLERAKNLAK